MKRKDLEEKGFTSEQIEFVMSEYGKDINPIKLELENLKKETADYETIKTEHSKLKSEKDKYKDYDAIKADNEKIKKEHEELLNEKKKNDNLKVLDEVGVDKDFQEFVLGKIEVPEGKELKEIATEYIKANPKYSKETFKNINTQLPLDGSGGKIDISKMPTDEYIKARRKGEI
jgi:hypothetical protein